MTLALLDTHAFVWAVVNPDRLGVQARRLVKDPTTELLVSAASAWELSTKVRLGNFAEAEPVVDQYLNLVDDLRATNLSVTPAHALRAGALRWPHRDPFDRMLAAQSMLEHAVLVSRDTAFASLGGVELAW